VGHIAYCISEATGDHVLRVRTAISEAFFEGGTRRWQDEYGHALGQRLSYLLRTLPVDFEDNVVSDPQLSFDGPSSCPVEVVENLGVFEELALRLQALEIANRYKMVLATVCLGGTLGSRGI
jgi:hypothetical protein